MDSPSTAWKKRNPERTRRINRNCRLKRTYGITLLEFEILLELQGGGCALCGTTDQRGLGTHHVDHDHETGKVRGILCHDCNTGIGSLGDDPARLRAAAEYLERYL